MENQLNTLIVFCGLFSYKDSEVQSSFPASRFEDFEDVFQKDPHIKILKQILYPNFFNIIVSKNSTAQSPFCDCAFKHLRLKDLTNFQKLLLINENEENIGFSVTKVDIFLFPEKISLISNEKMGIYAFHVNLSDQKAGFESISSFIYRIRQFESKNLIQTESNRYTTIDFIANELLSHHFSFDLVANIMGNKLKTFTVKNTDEELEDINKTLFEIGTAQHISSTPKEHATKGSDELYQKVTASNLVSLYSNWKALSIFDSFTVIGKDLHNISQTWGTTYLLIYIHCLKLKFYLFYINSELSNINYLKYHAEKLRASFSQFINCNNLYAISFNILPNTIYHAMKQSLEVNTEVEELEKKIIKINNTINEKNEKRLNRLVFLLALIGIVSAIFHASEFVEKLFENHNSSYRQIGMSISGITVFLISAYIFLLRKKIH